MPIKARVCAHIWGARNASRHRFTVGATIAAVGLGGLLGDEVHRHHLSNECSVRTMVVSMGS
jgi:hypothetical protein